MNKFKEALEEIRNQSGEVCRDYETCDHPACKSSYEAWSIADKVLTEYSNISSSVSPSTSYPIGDPEIRYFKVSPLFKALLIGLLIICFVLSILCISEISYNKKWINKNAERILELENTFNTKLEFDTFKKLTSDEFERTWRSFGIIRNNFLALGTGFHLDQKDIMPEDEKENNMEN